VECGNALTCSAAVTHFRHTAAGYVATDLTKGQPGTISTEESVGGCLKVLQDGRELNGKFYSYEGHEEPW
jgi:hypothetical protein